MRRLNDSIPIEQFAAAQIAQSIESLTRALRQVGKTSAPDPIHDFRVGIRRFIQSLLLFPDFVPAAEVKQIKKRLKEAMDLTSEIRNRDVALDLLGDSENSKLKRQLRQDRTAYADQFAKMTRQWKAERLPASWRSALGAPRQ